MPKLPTVSAKEAVKAFKKLGFSVVVQKGSHIKIAHNDGRIATIPNHRAIKKGTLKKGILNPLKISVAEFIATLKK